MVKVYMDGPYTWTEYTLYIRVHQKSIFLSTENCSPEGVPFGIGIILRPFSTF